MKTLILTLSLFWGAAALADDRQAHYQPTIPKGYNQALSQLEQASSQAQTARNQADLRAMHEASYDMEAALEVMQTELNTIAQEVELMHKASERNQKTHAYEALEAFAPKIQALSN